MKVSLMNEKILFQKSVVQVDEIGNRKNGWEDYFSCFATIGGEGGSEKSVAGHTVDELGITFTVRYCKKAAAVCSDQYRILFREELYNIISVDHMNFRKKSLKFRCEKVRR